VDIVFGHNDEQVLDGFLTFVHVGPDGRPLPHCIVIDAVNPVDWELQERAKALYGQR
jgi:hypothetical protein